MHPGFIGYTYQSYIKNLIVEERLGTADNYHCSYVSFKKMCGNVRFQAITPGLLRQYEIKMLKAKRSKTTIGIYLRALRVVVNEAINAGFLKKDAYPFGKRKYQIPSGRKVKKALTLDHIAYLLDYIPKCTGEQFGKDFWLFFYLGNGMNPMDAAHLKYKDMKDNFIVFYRKKIENTAKSEAKPITVYLTEEILEIIDRQGNKDRNPENYIFPILQPGLEPLDVRRRIKNFIRLVNKWIKRVCGNLEFSEQVSTIVCRHTCATVLQNSGASTEFIQETLGHMDKQTTENYLAGFILETKKEFAGKLIPMKGSKEAKQVS